MPAAIEVLPEIAEAVDGRAEVLVDGGVRRGTDVLKALALALAGCPSARQVPRELVRRSPSLR